VQRVARELDRVERRRAGGIQGERPASQAECLREDVRWVPRHEAVARIDVGQSEPLDHLDPRKRRWLPGEPDPLGEPGHQRRWVRQVADHGAGSRKVTAIARIAEGLAADVEQPLEQRIEADGLVG